MKTCPICGAPIDKHDLDSSWTCLEALSAAAGALTRRACGGAAAAVLEGEMRRPSAAWRV